MLSLARDPAQPAGSARGNIDVETQEREQQQASQQCQIARPRLGASIPKFCRWNGPKRPVKHHRQKRLSLFQLAAIGMEAANFSADMRTIKLSGREASVVRAIGFTNSML